VSHDRLTRLLQGNWSGQTRLECTFRTRFVWERGYLRLDDTVIPKPLATALESLAWGFSSQERKPVYGCSRVLLIWTNGTLRIPRGVRLWRKGGPSKYEVALELLSYARHRRRCRPESVLFEAWYPAKALVKRLRDDGWYCGCRLKQNRRCNGQPVRAYRRHPYGIASGWLPGTRKGLGVRAGAKYYATNRLVLPAAAGRRWYRLRAHMEEGISVGNDQLRLTGGQARSERAQLHPITCCLMAFCVLEQEREARHLSVYQRKRQRSFKGRSMALPALKQLGRAA
jgi:Transposase DDE domain